MKVINIIIILILYNVSCTYSFKDDIYRVYPKGTILTEEILKKSNQIYFYKTDLILVVNMSKEWNGFTNHLLFFNKNNQLYSASYFSSSLIGYIEDGVISSVFFKERDKKKKYFTNDLPSNYKFNFINRHIEKSVRISNKLIKTINFNKETKNVELIILQTKDYSKGLRWNVSNVDSTFFNDYTLKDTIILPLRKLKLNYNSNIIVNEYIDNKKLVYDNLIVYDKVLLDSLYTKILTSPHG